MKKMMLVALLVLLCAGCGTLNRGRISVLDIDTRDPEQIKAYEAEAAMPFAGPAEDVAPNPLGDQGPRLGISPLQWFVDLVGILKGRIRIGTFEWTDQDTK